MTKNQKIAIGIGGLALAYFLFKDKIKEVFTLSAPKGNNSYDAPKQSQATPQQTNPLEPSTQKQKINVHTCKDGFKINVPDYGNMITFAKVEDPCRNHGGTVNYVPLENVSSESKCPSGFKKVERMCKQAPCPYDCVPYAKPNGMV